MPHKETMSYDYSKMRPDLLTDEGQRTVCEALLDAQALGKANGLITHDALTGKINATDNWRGQAVIDRLIEMRYLVPVNQAASDAERIYRWIARAR